MNVESGFFDLPLDDDLIPQIRCRSNKRIEKSHRLDQETKRRIDIIGRFCRSVDAVDAVGDVLVLMMIAASQRFDSRRCRIDDTAQQFQSYLPQYRKYSPSARLPGKTTKTKERKQSTKRSAQFTDSPILRRKVVNASDTREWPPGILQRAVIN